MHLNGLVVLSFTLMVLLAQSLEIRLNMKGGEAWDRT